MKKYFILVTALTFFLINFSNTLAQDSGFGLGVILGEPTGLSGKYWLDNNNALDIALGYSFIPKDAKISMHVDYLYHLQDVIQSEESITLYYGFGLRLRARSGKQGSFGVRGVIGGSLPLKNIPVEFFLEVAPVFLLLPATALNFDVGIGGRYYFNN